MMYAYSENFVLPLSHDEVVHLKRSLLGKMPGDRWQMLANLRLLLAYQWTFPGKKLLFMGAELAQPTEWDFRSPLPWHLLDDPANAGVQQLVADLNRLVRRVGRRCIASSSSRVGSSGSKRTMPRTRCSASCGCSGEQQLLVVLNFTPVPRHDWRVGVPSVGEYREVLNSDSHHYGGTNVGNSAVVRAEGDCCEWQTGFIEVEPAAAGGAHSRTDRRTRKPSIAGRLRGRLSRPALEGFRILRASSSIQAQTDASTVHASDKCALPSQTARTPQAEHLAQTPLRHLPRAHPSQ